MGNVTGTKTGARHRTRYSGEQDRIVYHPEYGVMKYKSGWLSIPDKNFNIGEAEIVDYKETMRVKGKTSIPGIKKERVECDRCGKKVRSLTEGLCDVCFRATEDVEDEIAKMRQHVLYGASAGNNGANWTW